MFIGGPRLRCIYPGCLGVITDTFCKYPRPCPIQMYSQTQQVVSGKRILLDSVLVDL